MANDIESLLKQYWELFAESTPKQLDSFLARSRTGDKQASGIIRFSIFDPSHIKRAEEVWNIFFDIANSSNKPDEELMQDVKKEFIRLRDEENENPELLYHALMVFITHHPKASLLSIPSIFVREPQKIIPSRPLSADLTESSSTTNIIKKSAPSADEGHAIEEKLNWFREDPLLNEHHQHWHVVYPRSGIRGGVKDRQGELFFYMHQQMLARYDTERIALGIDKVVAFSNYDASINHGYDPGKILTDPGEINLDGIIKFSIRKPGSIFKNDEAADKKGKLGGMNDWKKKMHTAVKEEYLVKANKKVAFTPHLFGSTLEPSSGSVNPEYYGFLHGAGHIFTAFCEDPLRKQPEMMGVIGDGATASRDPFFWEWHKHIDDFIFQWQQARNPHDFSDYPNVLLRKGIDESGNDWTPDIIFMPFSALKNVPEFFKESGVVNSELLRQFANSQFGESNWDLDFTDSAEMRYEYAKNKAPVKYRTVAGLTTFMEKGKIKFLSGSTTNGVNKYLELEYEYLNHERFFYYLRLQNNSNLDKKITARVFLVPETEVENRRMWMELDKFVYTLKANEKAVIIRRDTDSSIIRKPAIEHPDTYNIHYKPRDINVVDPVNFKNTIEEIKNNPKQGPQQYKGELDRTFSNCVRVLSDYIENNAPSPNVDKQIETVKSCKAAAEESASNPDQYKLRLAEYEEALLNLIIPVQNFIRNRAYCECGWPYNLLLPRGQKGKGMKFTIMVMITDWNKDTVGEEDCCGSMSYCGAKERYPDDRPMGYPFDRPIRGSISELIRLQPNMACRTITLKFGEKDEPNN